MKDRSQRLTLYLLLVGVTVIGLTYYLYSTNLLPFGATRPLQENPLLTENKSPTGGPQEFDLWLSQPGEPLFAGSNDLIERARQMQVEMERFFAETNSLIDHRFDLWGNLENQSYTINETSYAFEVRVPIAHLAETNVETNFYEGNLQISIKGKSEHTESRLGNRSFSQQNRQVYNIHLGDHVDPSALEVVFQKDELLVTVPKTSNS